MKNKKYLILYYICFLITLSFHLLTTHIFNISTLLLIINILITSIFTYLIIRKRKLNIKNLLFPITYLIFFIIVVGLCFLINTKTLVPYLHFQYYQIFIIINFTLLNVYSILSIKEKKK